MQTTPRKTKAAAPRKTTRKSASDHANASPTQDAIAKAVHDYMAAHYDSLLVHAAIAHGPQLDAMFAEIDRNLDASEQLTAQLLARD